MCFLLTQVHLILAQLVPSDPESDPQVDPLEDPQVEPQEDP